MTQSEDPHKEEGCSESIQNQTEIDEELDLAYVESQDAQESDQDIANDWQESEQQEENQEEEEEGDNQEDENQEACDNLEDDEQDQDPSSKHSINESQQSEFEEMDEDITQEILDFNTEFPCFESYQIIDKIGEGTFSSVYLAIDRNHYKYENEGWCHNHIQRTRHVKVGKELLKEGNCGFVALKVLCVNGRESIQRAVLAVSLVNWRPFMY